MREKSCRFTIYHKPVPWTPARVTKHGAYDKKYYQKRDIRCLILEAYGDQPKLEGPLEVHIVFGFKVPKSYSLTKRYNLEGTPHDHLPDVTNCLKLMEDCMKGICYDDDRTNHYVTAKKVWAAEDYISVTLIQKSL